MRAILELFTEMQTEVCTRPSSDLPHLSPCTDPMVLAYLRRCAPTELEKSMMRATLRLLVGLSR